jgi:hypothetical protein
MGSVRLGLLLHILLHGLDGLGRFSKLERLQAWEVAFGMGDVRLGLLLHGDAM